jgi:hypothetical protein
VNILIGNPERENGPAGTLPDEEEEEDESSSVLSSWSDCSITDIGMERMVMWPAAAILHCFLGDYWAAAWHYIMPGLIHKIRNIVEAIGPRNGLMFSLDDSNKCDGP